MSITIINLFKSYKDRVILNHITYSFEDKKKYLIIGDNGIGKTTLIKCILNQIKYDGVINTKDRIGYARDGGYYPGGLTLYNFIYLFSSLDSKVKSFDKRLNDLKEKLDLDIKNKSLLSSLSKGEKMKANLIKTLLTPSECLIFDEPLSGLDEESKKAFVNILKKEDKLVIVISHEKDYFDEEFKRLTLIDGDLIDE